MTSSIFYIDGEFVPQEKAHLPILDLGLLRGLAVFDYIRTYNGKPFHLDEHLLRLAYSAQQLGLNLPETLASCKQKILETLHNNSFVESSIKILITAGTSPDQFLPSSASKLYILVYPLTTPSVEDCTNGIATVTTSLQRPCPTSKTTHYAPGIVSLQKDRTAKDALYLSPQGHLLEGVTTNFFAFRKGVLHTIHSDEVLMGITRQVVLKLCPYPVSLTPIHYGQIQELEEAFVTSTSKEVLPVVSIDGKPIGGGQVGAKTRHLMQLFFDYARQESHPELLIERHQIAHSQPLKEELFFC